MLRVLFLLVATVAADPFTGTMSATTFSRTLATHLRSNRRSQSFGSSAENTVRNVKATKQTVAKQTQQTLTGGQMQALKYVDMFVNYCSYILYQMSMHFLKKKPRES